MPSPSWFFKRFAPGDNVSDPDFTKALFASDSDTAVARSLVREALQNSLDARSDDSTSVRVRIAIHRDQRAVPADVAAPFTAGLGPHLAAADAGLPDAPAPGAPVSFLLLEDFGTNGLRGDPEHWRPVDIRSNGFFLFFRALGRSGKDNEARGRWGVGKFVFPMSSRAHAILGLTIPHNTRQPLLMGRAVLRTHATGNEEWHPDGHWGERRTADSNLVSPSRDPELIERFRRTFGLARTTEPGLSVVVPWVVDDIRLEGIRDAVLGEYFLPLLRSELLVELDDNGTIEVLDGAAVRAYAERADDRSLRERLALAVTVADQQGLSLAWPKTLEYDDLQLKPEDLPEEMRNAMSAALDEGRALSVAIPVTIGRKTATRPPSGTLHVHMRQRDGLGAVAPLLIRDGISISQDRTKKLYDHVVLLVAERCGLATAIGDSETPAHEQMQHELLKEQYKYPKKLVTFVRESAWSLLRAIRHGDTEDDAFTLASFFPVEADIGRPVPPGKPKPGGTKPAPGPGPLPVPKPRRFNVRKTVGGFKVVGNPEAGTVPEEIAVAVAYDVRRGNPFKRYRRFDFDLAAKGIRMQLSGCAVETPESNRLVVRPAAPDFELAVSGFDAARDLVIRVTAVGGDA